MILLDLDKNASGHGSIYSFLLTGLYTNLVPLCKRLFFVETFDTNTGVPYYKCLFLSKDATQSLPTNKKNNPKLMRVHVSSLELKLG